MTMISKIRRTPVMGKVTDHIDRDLNPELEEVAAQVEISEKEPYRSDSLDSVSYFDDEPSVKTKTTRRSMGSYSTFDDVRIKERRTHSYNEFDRIWNGK